MTIRPPSAPTLLFLGGAMLSACAGRPVAPTPMPIRRTATEGNSGSIAAPSTKPSTAQEAQQEAYRASSQGRYLDAVLLLESFPTEKIPPSAKTSFLQSLAVFQSWVGDEIAALKSMDEGSRAFQPAGANPFNDIRPGAKLAPAIPFIVRAAKERRALFINEAHHVPRHRALTLQLLRELRSLGYTHFAAETLSDEKSLNELSYPTATSGYYSSEPVYGELIREARRLGYRIVTYEDMRMCSGNPPERPYHCQNQREEGQALNLKQKVFDKSPQAKLVVHAGYGHVDKKGHGEWKPMARYFTEATGVDPLVIDQTTLSEKGSVEFDDGTYLAAQELLEDPKSAKEALVIDQPNEGVFVAPMSRGHYDVQVFHPRAVYRQGRETWREMGGRRTYVNFPHDPCATERPCLLEARRADEPVTSVPSDLVIVRDGQPIPALLLPPGPFKARAWGRDGRLLSERDLSANAP